MKASLHKLSSTSCNPKLNSHRKYQEMIGLYTISGGGGGGGSGGSSGGCGELNSSDSGQGPVMKSLQMQ